MKIVPLLAVLMLAALSGVHGNEAAARQRNVTDANAPRSLAGEGAVAVRWDDPAAFTELRASGNRWEAARGDWVRELAGYLRKRATPLLLPGQRLDVTLHNIKRAGNYEPGRQPGTDNVRMVRDLYPPRIALSFRLRNADGQDVSAGERKLTDLAFLDRTPHVTDTDPLRYEKRLIDDWLQREFATPRK